MTSKNNLIKSIYHPLFNKISISIESVQELDFILFYRLTKLKSRYQDVSNI